MWFIMNNIDSHSIECAIYNVYKHRVLRLRSTDWKSSLNKLFIFGSNGNWRSKKMNISVPYSPYHTVFWLNCRIPRTLFASYCITIASIVIYLVLQSTPTHAMAGPGYSAIAPVFLTMQLTGSSDHHLLLEMPS